MTNKKFFFNLAATALMGAALSACSSDLDNVANADRTLQPIQLKGSVQDLVVSRAATELQGGELKANSNVGLFVAKTKESNETNYTTIANGDNTKLTVGSDGALSVADTDTKLYWEADKLNFYAYAPYSSSYNSKLASTTSCSIDFTVQADQTSDDNYIASDLLYGKPNSNPVSQTTDAVSLGFSHKLAKVIVTVQTKTDATTNQTNISLYKPGVKLLNVVKNVTLDLTTGTATAGSTTGEVALNTTTATSSTTKDDDATSYSYAAIIAPQTISTNTNFIQIDNLGVTYYCQLSSEQKMEGGKVYTYTVTFNGQSADVTLTSTLTNWEDGANKTEIEDPVSPTTYKVGDYLLSDGSLIQKSAVTADNSVIGVIFSTNLSEADKEAGYTAYILGTYKLGTAVPIANSATITDWTYYTSLTSEWTDLDGLTSTKKLNTASTTNYPFYDLSAETSLPTNLGNNFSDWFIPSIGQMLQILNNLGKADIPAASNKTFYAGLPNITSDNSNVKTDDNGNSYVSLKGEESVFTKTLTASQVIANLNSSLNNVEVFSSAIYALSSLKAESKPFMLRLDKVEGSNLTDAELVGGWGFSILPSATSAKSRLACIATKLPLTND